MPFGNSHAPKLLLFESQDISSKKGDFLSLSIEGVKVILDSDALMVAYEEEVFQILLDWIDANCRTADEKQFAVEEVAGVIRFPWMTGDFLIDVVSTNPQMHSAACQVETNYNLFLYLCVHYLFLDIDGTCLCLDV